MMMMMAATSTQVIDFSDPRDNSGLSSYRIQLLALHTGDPSQTEALYPDIEDQWQ